MLPPSQLQMNIQTINVVLQFLLLLMVFVLEGAVTVAVADSPFILNLILLPLDVAMGTETREAGFLVSGSDERIFLFFLDL